MGVRCLKVSGSKVFSGLLDSSIKTFSLRGHTDWVNDLNIHRKSNTMWTASDDTTVCLFDLRTKKRIKTSKGHVGQVQQVLLMSADFGPNEESDAASIESGRSLTPPTQSPSHASQSAAMAPETEKPILPGLTGDSLHQASGSQDSSIKIWEPKPGACQTTYRGHPGPVSAVIFDDTKFVSAGEDGNFIVRSFEADGLLAACGELSVDAA
ncbi:hypothetical protein ACHAO5_009210 [Verticillium nonalfalfae]